MNHAIDYWLEYDQKVKRRFEKENQLDKKDEKKEKEKKEKEKEKEKEDAEKEEKEKEENAENPENKPEEVNNEVVEAEKKKENITIEEAEEEGEIVLKDYQTIEKRYVLCMDNIGQDKEYTEGELNFIMDISSLIKASWENQEKALILKDRDLRLQMMELENNYRVNVIIFLILEAT